MSKILELAKTFEQTSKQQAESIENELRNVMNQHSAAIKNDLQRVQNEIESSTRELTESVRGELQRVLQGKIRRAVVWLWILAAIGAALVMLSGYLTTVQSRRIIEQQLRIEALRESGANVTRCKRGEELVPCVEVVQNPRGWKTGKDSTIYMEIAQ